MISNPSPMAIPNLAEQLRSFALQDLDSIKSFKAGWHERADYFDGLLANAPLSRSGILSLGDHLSGAFRLEGSNNRSQGSLSNAGAVWEALVVWYLNLCLAGTQAVCIRRGQLIPKCLCDALSICFESAVLRSEPDVVVVSCEKLLMVPPEGTRKKAMERAAAVIEANFGATGLVNIQCKTNWNDNAQIPMLWNMLYNQARKGAVVPNGFTIGTNGHTLSGLGHFGYAFVTVPTQKKAPHGYKPQSVEVLRAKTMTAGNYWGYPSKNGVCLSIREFFGFLSKNPKVFPAISDVAVAAATGCLHGRCIDLTQFKLGGLCHGA